LLKRAAGFCKSDMQGAPRRNTSYSVRRAGRSLYVSAPPVAQGKCWLVPADAQHVLEPELFRNR